MSFSLARFIFLSITAKVKSNPKFQNRRHLRIKLRNEALKYAKPGNMTSYHLLSAKGT